MALVVDVGWNALSQKLGKIPTDLTLSRENAVCSVRKRH